MPEATEHRSTAADPPLDVAHPGQHRLQHVALDLPAPGLVPEARCHQRLGERHVAVAGQPGRGPGGPRRAPVQVPGLPQPRAGADPRAEQPAATPPRPRRARSRGATAQSGKPVQVVDAAVQRVRWIVDPLDGSVNYLYGLPDWAVSIAAEVDGTVVAGAVFVPRRDELYSAGIGTGAWLSRALHRRGEDTGSPARLACNRDVPLAQALVATGFGYEAGRLQGPGRRAAGGAAPGARHPARRSAAVDPRWRPLGTVDADYERGVNLSDIAAGGLIVAEAGAWVIGLHGRPPSRSTTIAAAPPLLGERDDLLASTDPERDA